MISAPAENGRAQTAEEPIERNPQARALGTNYPTGSRNDDQSSKKVGLKYKLIIRTKIINHIKQVKSFVLAYRQFPKSNPSR